MDTGLIVAEISLIVAVGVAIFTWQTVRISNKTYKAGLIASIYEKYHSLDMRQDHKKTWAIYYQAWMEHCNNKEEAKKLTTQGEPITKEMAISIVKKMEKSPKKYAAIDNMFGLWTYMMLLIFQKALNIEELSAFATPRILGLLYPIDEAKASLYGYKTHPKYSLKKLYDVWKKKYPTSF